MCPTVSCRAISRCRKRALKEEPNFLNGKNNNIPPCYRFALASDVAALRGPGHPTDDTQGWASVLFFAGTWSRNE